MSVRFAFYGRVSTEDQQDPEASRNWQFMLSRNLTATHGDIVTEFFDIGQSRSLPWVRRPHAARLLRALEDPHRGFDAIVVGEPQRAFYGGQFADTFPKLVHFGVDLWVPEVGGRVDPESEAHDLMMNVFGGMSKAERNRVRLRVKSAMTSQAQLEGRFLGGRPPYGYTLADVGPHPNPGKAAEGRRLHQLAEDPATAPVVRRIFTLFIAGAGYYAIAEELTRDGVPSPSEHDRARNKHRTGQGWSKFAVRNILLNPRYLGHQVWGKQRKDESLIDVTNVALGHEVKQRWNPADKWVTSERLAHDPLVDNGTFDTAQQIIAGRGRGKQRTHRAVNPYLFKGLLYCGLCGRKMQGQKSNGHLQYRCRYAAEYALANHIEHPANVYLAERHLAPRLDEWLAVTFAPHRVQESAEELFAAHASRGADPEVSAAQQTLAECDRKLAQHRAALEAGADAALVTSWMAETQAQKAQALAVVNRPDAATALTRDDIHDLLDRIGDVRHVLDVAEPEYKAPVYQQLGLRMTYQPGRRLVQVLAQLNPAAWGYGLCPRGDLNPHALTGH